MYKLYGRSPDGTHIPMLDRFDDLFAAERVANIIARTHPGYRFYVVNSSNGDIEYEC